MYYRLDGERVRFIANAYNKLVVLWIWYYKSKSKKVVNMEECQIIINYNFIKNV